MREAVDVKARRYLIEGRLRILDVTATSVMSHCVGDSAAIYDCGFANDDWFCNCPAVGRCAHVAALQLTVFRPREAP
jgi:hypothetical protein